jgi:hypothetical protein
MKKLLLLLLFILPSIAHADITTGLVGWWKFDEATSGTCSGTTPDSSGQGNTGTCTNSPTYVAGKIGAGAMSFDGSTQYVDGGNITAFNSMAALTVSAWVKPSALANLQVMVSKFSTVDAKGWAIETSTTGIGGSNSTALICGLQNNGADAYGYTANGVLANNTWVHIVEVFDGSQSGNARLKCYINGASRSLTYAGTIPAQTDNDTDAFRIGNSASNNRYFPGIIDDARVYNRALSAADVAQLYAYTGSVGNVIIRNAMIRNARLGY